MRVTIEIPNAVVEESPYVPRELAVVHVPDDDYKIFIRREWIVENPAPKLTAVEHDTEIIQIHGDGYGYEDNPRSTSRGY